MDLAETQAIAETARAEMRASLEADAAALARQLELTHAAELRYAQDPDRDDLMAEARDARAALDTERHAFDAARTTARRVQTRASNAAIAKLKA